MKGIATELDNAEIRDSSTFWRLLKSIKHGVGELELPSMEELVNSFRKYNLNSDYSNHFHRKI